MKMEDKIYHQILDHVLHLLSHHLPVEAIAGCLLAIAQRLYKTHLTDAEYKKIMKVAIESHVEPYDIKKRTFH
jgi:hypothetical protein|tara:strand:+ start:237 stop:455 length:219 start_codon:yes stop_codon:yes gene_type:complete